MNIPGCTSICLPSLLCSWAETLKLLTAHHFKNRICHNDMKVIIKKKKKKTLPMSSFLGEVGENFSLH